MKRQPINNDNYEEYFLLYVDNELTVAERASVEEYIEANPGLKAELEMFQSTRLDLEDVKMDGIENLYKHEAEGMINEGNYEEFQVLMVDGELNGEEQELLGSYHEDHPKAAANFEWLKKTKLPAEHIPFPDKSLLYRTEKKPASIISIQWFRYAAAAAVILMLALFFRESERQSGREADGGANVVAQTNTGSGLKEVDTQKAANANDVANANGAETAGTTTDAAKSQGAVMVAVKDQRAKTTKSVDIARSAPKAELQESIAVIEPQQIAAVEKNETRITAEELQKTTESATPNVPYAQPAVAMNVKTNYAAEALNGVHDEDADEMQVEEEGKQRRGLRGIVRKANRIYNKVTNPDLDKPLVKVANLEIGLQR